MQLQILIELGKDLGCGSAFEGRDPLAALAVAQVEGHKAQGLWSWM